MEGPLRYKAQHKEEPQTKRQCREREKGEFALSEANEKVGDLVLRANADVEECFVQPLRDVMASDE